MKASHAVAAASTLLFAWADTGPAHGACGLFMDSCGNDLWCGGGLCQPVP